MQPPAAALGPCSNPWPGWQRGQPLPSPGEAAQIDPLLQKRAAAWRGEGKPRQSSKAKPKLSFPGSCFTSRGGGLASPALLEIRNGLLQAQSHGFPAAAGRSGAGGGSTSASCPSQLSTVLLQAGGGSRTRHSFCCVDRNLRFPKLSI